MQISAAYSFQGKDAVVDTESIALDILSKLPGLKEALIKDVQAIYEGDPAAVSPEEVILSYPGFYAISIYRIAHEFYLRKIPYISRMMTEYAHEKTGIDIHAGATIGEYFFIDHGTGVVIGETATIGDRVKIYQGVTLGAKSFELDENGNPVKGGIKRHPDIGNGCVIYANATILGGRTKIGDGAIIGADVWVTSSVEPGTVVYYGKNG
jgi:serine O-acetyltransferase